MVSIVRNRRFTRQAYEFGLEHISRVSMGRESRAAAGLDIGVEVVDRYLRILYPKN